MGMSFYAESMIILYIRQYLLGVNGLLSAGIKCNVFDIRNITTVTTNDTQSSHRLNAETFLIG